MRAVAAVIAETCYYCAISDWMKTFVLQHSRAWTSQRQSVRTHLDWTILMTIWWYKYSNRYGVCVCVCLRVTAHGYKQQLLVLATVTIVAQLYFIYVRLKGQGHARSQKNVPYLWVWRGAKGVGAIIKRGLSGYNWNLLRRRWISDDDRRLAVCAWSSRRESVDEDELPGGLNNWRVNWRQRSMNTCHVDRQRCD